MDFQGNLKTISKKNLDHLKNRILEDGFNVPFFIWEHQGDYKTLDGHQRLKALLSLREDGYDMPLLPVAFIEADDEHDARKKLLAISSQYGRFNEDELTDWLSDFDTDVVESFRLLDKEISIDTSTEGVVSNESQDDDSVKESAEKHDQFAVIVYCSTEASRQKAVGHLTDLGYTCSAVDLELKKKK